MTNCLRVLFWCLFIINIYHNNQNNPLVSALTFFHSSTINYSLYIRRKLAVSRGNSWVRTPLPIPRVSSWPWGSHHAQLVPRYFKYACWCDVDGKRSLHFRWLCEFYLEVIVCIVCRDMSKMFTGFDLDAYCMDNNILTNTARWPISALFGFYTKIQMITYFNHTVNKHRHMQEWTQCLLCLLFFLHGVQPETD